MKSITSVVLVVLFLSACKNGGETTITETGTLEATEVTVSAQVPGVVQRILVEEGQSVAAGDTLVVLDATDVRFQLQQAEANARGAEAQARLAEEGPRKEDIAQAEANFQNAKADLKRMEELYTAKTIPEKQLDDIRTRFTLADQTLQKLRRGSRTEELALARAHRDQAQAQLAALRKKVSDCVVTAPLAGVVTKRFLEVGELAGPGASVARVADLSKLTLNIYVVETILPRIAIGQKASVRVDAFADRSFPAEIIYTSPTAEFTPKNIQTKDERVKLVFAVKLRVDNPNGTLKAGIPADATLILAGQAE